MTVDSSTTTITHSGEGGGINSPSRRRSLPSPWAQVVRGGCEPDTVVPRSPTSSPLVSKQSPGFSDRLTVFEPEPESVVVTSEAQPVATDGNASGSKKSAWNKPSANGAVEVASNPVMGAASWPALSESTRPVPKSSSSSDSSSKSTSDGLVTLVQAPVVSQTPQKPAKSTANSHSNTTHTHPVRQRPMKRGGHAGGASAGYNRPPPPPPPPLPPPFPLFNMAYGGSLVPAVMESPIREQPPFKANGWAPRPLRRNSFAPRSRGDGGLYNNGYGAKQIVPPPPPPPRGYFRPPHPSPASYIAGQPLRTYRTPMGYDMAAPFLYVPTLPPEPYRGAPLPPPMLIPVMDPPLSAQILNQIEYYFSDANLVKDNFLRSNMDEEGWVPISLVAGFRRVQSLTTDVQMILNSLRDSSSVEIQGDKVRRRNEWRKWVVRSSAEEKTVLDAVHLGGNGEVRFCS